MTTRYATQLARAEKQISDMGLRLQRRRKLIEELYEAYCGLQNRVRNTLGIFIE